MTPIRIVTALTVSALVGCSGSGKDNAASRQESAPAATGQVPVPVPEPVVASPYDTFDFANNRLDSAVVYAMSLDEAKVLRGIVFGRHGRQFAVEDAVIHAYLASRSWYKPDSTFANASLNETERANLDIIRGAETAKHAYVQPGDLRFIAGRTVTSEMLGHHTPKEWQLLASEVWAIRGHQFNDLPSPDDDFERDPAESLQFYYNDRYWYEPVKAFKRTDLTQAELALIDTIDVARIKDLDSGVRFGMMRLFQKNLLTEKNLSGSGLLELRLMRNEFFALHGRPFTTPWLKEIFARVPDYTPRADFKDSDLSDVERANIALIRRIEDREHEELSTKEVDGRNYVSMPLKWVRLLRNEIYARHGRMFKDTVLQSYFAGLPWYKPNPNFSESMLTPMEKNNVREFLAHEGRMRSGEGYPEG